MMSDHLLSLGFSDDDARSRAALAGAVDRAFAAAVGRPAQWRFWVPGRVELFGKHTDYAGGRSLVAAVPRGFCLAARARADALVRVVDAGRGVETTMDSTDARADRPGWATYVATAVARLAANFPEAALGADIVLASDLPPAAGLSSSSALIVGVALALARVGRLEERDEWRDAIRTPVDLAGYLGALEAGAAFGTLASTTGVGTHGGSEDHTAILTARAGMASLYRFVPVRHLGDVAMPAAWTCVIATSGVHADKIGGARERFNRASAAARALLELWCDRSEQPWASLADALAAAPDAATRLSEAIELRAHPMFGVDELRRRLEHFVREDARVAAAAEAFARADAASLGALAQASQAEAETLLGNQVAETIDLAAAARDAGAFAASSFGAGFGGSVWALVPSGDAPRFGPAWVGRYRARQPERTGVDWFEARPSPAALELRT